MSTIVPPATDPPNPESRPRYAKKQLIFHEPGVKVLVQALRWLNDDKISLKDNLVAELNQSAAEIIGIKNDKLKESKIGKVKLEELDFSFLFKMIQTVCGLPLQSDPVWTNEGQTNGHDRLECHLIQMIEGHRSLTREGILGNDLPDPGIEKICEDWSHRFASLLQGAGQRAHEDQEVINETISLVQSDIERIKICDDTDALMKNHLRRLVRNDLKAQYEEGLKPSFEREWARYCAPHLRLQDDPNSSLDLRDLLTVAKDSQVILIQGEIGVGKTALTRCLHHSWMLGRDESLVNGLPNFDVAFRVECRHIHNKEMLHFFESYLPSSSYSFSQTSNMKKELDDLKVLWIMDGYDECTAEFKGFFKSLTGRLPPQHKLLVTTRPTALGDLKTTLSGLTFVTLSLELLTDNIISEITKRLIADDDNRILLEAKFDALDEVTKSNLRIPLNLILFLGLCKNDSGCELGSYTSKNLYMKSTFAQLNSLIKRVSSSSAALTTTVNEWFKDTLCKQCFLMSLRWDNVISCKAFGIIIEETSLAGLNLRDCLSSFLVEIEEGGIYKYDFQHTIQQYVLASHFVKNIQICPELKELIGSPQIYPTLKLLIFYVEMAVEDNSINTNTELIFEPLRKLSGLFKTREQCYIWCSTSVAAKFNVNFMEKVSNTLKDHPCLDTTIFDSFLEIAKFVKFVHPKKIRITLSNTLDPQDSQELVELVAVLSEQPIEVHLHTVFEEVEGSDGASEIALINESSLKLTSFTGTLTELSLLSNHHESLESIELVIYSETEFFQLCDILIDCESLKEIDVYIIYDNFSVASPSAAPEFPKEFSEMTTLYFRHLSEDNIDDFVRFFRDADGAVKFQALYHCMDNLSEDHERLLDQVASMVVYERCPYIKSMKRSSEFSMYTSPQEFHEVNSWKYCFQTYRNRVHGPTELTPIALSSDVLHMCTCVHSLRWH